MTKRDEHTLGPWHIEHEKDGRIAIYSRKTCEAVCSLDYNGGALDPDPMPNAEANARLIAAAPALLEAAERLVRNLDVLSHSDDEGEPSPWDEACEALRSAIAQARKETR